LRQLLYILSLSLALVLVLHCQGAAQAAPADVAPEQEARYQALLGQLRCLVCQNQSIAESNAPLAEDLRRQVREMIRRGESDEAIKRYLTDRYGEFVLYRPRVEPRTWLLWGGPFLLLATALLAAMLVFRHRPTGQAQDPPDRDAVRRLLEERERR
jgi:cytochrome c-type biogenesis protein CcmH